VVPGRNKKGMYGYEGTYCPLCQCSWSGGRVGPGVAVLSERYKIVCVINEDSKLNIFGGVSSSEEGADRGLEDPYDRRWLVRRRRACPQVGGGFGDGGRGRICVWLEKNDVVQGCGNDTGGACSEDGIGVGDLHLQREGGMEGPQ
jgi:hypothetical protein